MTQIIPKRSAETWRGHVIQTRPWQAIADFYRERINDGVPLEPLLNLVEAINTSEAASEISGATSMSHFDLLVSDSPDFHSGDSTLHISYSPTDRVFEFRHHCFSGHDDQRTCAETEGLQTLSLFLRYKYGVPFGDGAI